MATLTEEQQKAVLQDMVTIYNKINADLDNLRDKQQLFANLLQGYNAILNPEESPVEKAETDGTTTVNKKSK